MDDSPLDPVGAQLAAGQAESPREAEDGACLMTSTETRKNKETSKAKARTLRQETPNLPVRTPVDGITYRLAGLAGWTRAAVIDALRVALVVGGSTAVPHVRRAFGG